MAVVVLGIVAMAVAVVAVVAVPVVVKVASGVGPGGASGVGQIRSRQRGWPHPSPTRLAQVSRPGMSLWRDLNIFRLFRFNY